MSASPTTGAIEIPNDYPVELTAPDITPYAAGNTGTPYIWSFDSGTPGPHVMISALVHGNEICGAIALDWLLRREVRPVRGSLSLGFVNIDAYSRFDPKDPNATRWADEDFNRLWSDEVLSGERDSSELRRAREIRPFIDSVDILLDIHSMQRPSPAFMMAGMRSKGRDLARQIGVPEIVISDQGHATGVRMRDYSGFSDPASPKNAVLIECGQHWEKAAADLAIDTSLRMLRAQGTIADDFGGDLGRGATAPQTFVEVTEAVTVKTEKDFTFIRPFTGGETIPDKGTLIAHDGDEEILTPYDNCFLVMPSMRLWKGQTAVRLGKITG
jgi:predicted deacylase